jgi:hypothetical protein
MRKKALFVALLAIMLTLPGYAAWGHATHRDVTARVLDSLPEAEREYYSAYAEEITEFSTLPDIWRAQEDPRGALEYHLSYPTGYGKGPEAAAVWYQKLVAAIASESYDEMALAAGVLSHYVGDALCALHTDAYVPEHPIIERHVNENVTWMAYEASMLQSRADVVAMVRSASLEAHGGYEPMVDACREEQWDAVDALVEVQLESYASLYATLLCMAYEEAVGSEEAPMPEESGTETRFYALAAVAVVILVTAVFAINRR